MMTASVSDWLVILPELWVGLLTLALLSMDILLKEERKKSLGTLAILGLLPIFPILIALWQLPPATAFGGMVRLDTWGLFFKGIFILTAILILLMAREGARSLKTGEGEFYLLILTATMGMLLAACANDFLMLFVSLELITISFYVMVSYLRTNTRSLEAGLKYLILGSISSALFLYGIAFLYGTTGSTQFPLIRQVIEEADSFSPGILFGLLLILAGIFFKAAAVPFQLWVPDVYEGAPTPVTAFLSVGSKTAGFLVLLKVLHELALPLGSHWSGILAAIAGLTILYGNLGAIPQKNIKRLLGYSSIGHAGYLLIGVATASALGSTATNFYLLSYLVTNLSVFLVVAAFSKHVDSDLMRDYAGLSKRSPFLAAVMFIGLLSLAGVPPLSGFFGKFLLLLSAVQEGYIWLAVIGAAAVVISLYYYLLLVKVMYVDPPEDPAPIPVSAPVRVALLFCLIAILGIGIWQAPFVNLSFAATKSLF